MDFTHLGEPAGEAASRKTAGQSPGPNSRPRRSTKGRPREFDLDDALDAVLRVFWRKGYEATSIDDLTTATGVARPSLYNAFGNKEGLFRHALDRYRRHYLAYVDAALNESSAAGVVKRLLLGAADMQTRYPTSPGCMGVHGMLTGSEEAEKIRHDMIDRSHAVEDTLCQRLKHAQEEGDLPPSANCSILAQTLITLAQGMAVQAKAGACKASLEAVAQQMLAFWLSACPAPTGEKASD